MNSKVPLPSFNPHDTSDENLSRAIGQLLIVGFHGKEPPKSLRSALKEGIVGGTIIFRRNVESIEQVVEMTEMIHQSALDAVAPPWVALDQEGGRVVRLRGPLTEIPPMRSIGRLKNRELIAQVAEIIATEVGALGFNLNFAPVLDVDTNPDNPVIGDRAFSDDPEVVGKMAGIFLFSYLLSGVVPCGKHFPGHGDTHIDSHLDLPVIEHDLDRLRAVELVPFIKAIQANYPMLMTAHVKVPAIDTVHPASFSHAIISGLLRERLQYNGLIVTDCLEMKAVADRYSIEEMVELGIRAGVHLFLICHTEEKWRRAHNHLLSLAKRSELDRICLVQAANKIVKTKNAMFGSFPRPWRREPTWRDLIGSPDHKKVMHLVDEKLAEACKCGKMKSEFDINACISITPTAAHHIHTHENSRSDPTESD